MLIFVSLVKQRFLIGTGKHYLTSFSTGQVQNRKVHGAQTIKSPQDGPKPVGIGRHGLLRAMHRCTSFKTIDRDLDVRHNCIAHAP
jgi:hypothetical protein